MEPEDIRGLRERLGLSMLDLANHLQIDVALLIAWESGDRFPTKKHVAILQALAEGGPQGVRTRQAPAGGFLADPRFPAALRKLLGHEKLQEEFLELAERYEDPTGKR